MKITKLALVSLLVTLIIFGIACTAETKYSLNVDVYSGQGVVTPSYGTYTEGTAVTIAAMPDSGWEFDRWDGDTSGDENPTIVRISRDKIIQAYFVEIQVPTSTPTSAPTTTPTSAPTTTPTSAPTPTPTSAPTPTPVGDTRLNPVPVGQSLQCQSRELTVLNVWDEPYTSEQKWIYARIRVRFLQSPGETDYISDTEFRAVGATGKIAPNNAGSLGVADGFVFGEYFGGATVEGNIRVKVDTSDSNFVLIWSCEIGKSLYFALPTTPSTTVAPTPTPTTAPVGETRSNPVPVDQPKQCGTQELTVLSAERLGDEVHIAARIIMLQSPDETDSISGFDFRIVGVKGIINDFWTMGSTNGLSGEYFGGTTVEGTIVYPVSSDDYDFALIWSCDIGKSLYFDLGF